MSKSVLFILLLAAVVLFWLRSRSEKPPYLATSPGPGEPEWTQGENPR